MCVCMCICGYVFVCACVRMGVFVAMCICGYVFVCAFVKGTVCVTMYSFLHLCAKEARSDRTTILTTKLVMAGLANVASACTQTVHFV
jgi:heme/copper-type cytochrome/quinol oxidase subunit 4